MNKRIFSAILVPFMLFVYAVCAMLFFCGCDNSAASRPLTRDEYKAALSAAWDEFCGGTNDYLRACNAAGEDFDKYRASADQLQAACDRTVRGLKGFAEIVPPEEFEEMHKKLLKAAEDEKRWSSYREQSFKTDSREESDRILDKLAQEIDGMPLEDLLSDIILKLYNELGGFGSR